MKNPIIFQVLFFLFLNYYIIILEYISDDNILFYDFAPNVFYHLRQKFGIDSEHYLVILIF